MMRVIGKAAFWCSVIVLLVAASGGAVMAQQASAAAKTGGSTAGGAGTLTQAQVDAIITTFARRETQFRRALNEYAFKRDAMVQVLGMGGQVTGEYHRVSNFTFDDQGKRFEKINFFPMPSFAGVTPEDLEDLGGVNPFALEADKISQYNFTYVGKERIDELDLYVFDVAPKVTPDAKKTKERFFIGRIWVDDHDLQIVKSKGKGIPETKVNKFPVVETYREQVDGKYWFPTYSYADDDLIYDDGTDMRIRLRVRYSDYAKGHATVIIKEVDDTKPPPQSSPGEPATTPIAEPDKPVEGGILNGRAIALPLPDYPEEAKKVHAAGEVQVHVLIDENGKVVSAEAVFGPEVLRPAALNAVRKARFRPYVLNGITVKISGIVTYKFTEPKSKD